MNEALVLLAMVWAVLLVPSALRSRNASPHATVGGFERAMDVLRSESGGSSGGRRVLVPADADRIVRRPGREGGAPDRVPGRTPQRDRSSNPVVARRLAWFLRGLAAVVVTLIVAVIAGGWFWLPFAVSVSATAVYVAVLRHLKLQRDEARQVVSELELQTPDPSEHDRDVAVGADDWVGSGTVRLRRWGD